MSTKVIETIEYDEPGGLINCPFCGSDSVILLGDWSKDVYRVECRNCKALGPQIKCLEPRSPQTAAKKWNKRVRKYRRAQ